MKNIIGGLLVVSLMSTPAQAVGGYEEYDWGEMGRTAIYVLKYTKPYSGQIYGTLASIEDNTRKITALLAEKNRAVSAIYTAMDTFAQARAILTETQITKFSNFVARSKLHGAALQDALQTIDARKGLNEVKKELLHKDADFAFVYNELKDIEHCQDRALTSLDAILDAAKDCLAELGNAA